MWTRRKLYEAFGFYDERRFIRVTSKDYVLLCNHPEPMELGPIDNELNRECSKFNTSEVKLTMYAEEGTQIAYTFNGYGQRLPQLIGYAGKCEVCGKVYWK